MSEDDKFAACLLMPEGWVVLGPWVETPDGHRWRPHWLPTVGPKYGDAAKAEAEHYAREFNKAAARAAGESEK
jgi:hypothetical protein